jgi:hypothetical protein
MALRQKNNQKEGHKGTDILYSKMKVATKLQIAKDPAVRLICGEAPVMPAVTLPSEVRRSRTVRYNK